MPEPKWIGCAPNNFRQGRPAHVEVEAVVIHIIDGSQHDRPSAASRATRV